MVKPPSAPACVWKTPNGPPLIETCSLAANPPPVSVNVAMLPEATCCGLALKPAGCAGRGVGVTVGVGDGLGAGVAVGPGAGGSTMAPSIAGCTTKVCSSAYPVVLDSTRLQ